MATLAAFPVNAPVGGIDNPHLSAAMDGFRADLWPPQGYVYPTGLFVQPVSAFPVSAAGRTVTARRLRSYADDYYYRIHVTPLRLDMGNVASAQMAEITLWNAHLVPRTLDTVTGLDEGLALIDPPPMPWAMPALHEQRYELRVSEDGVPNLDTRVAFVFDHGEAPGVRVTANRVMAFWWLPDWSTPPRELLQWATDILTSQSLVEQRRALRPQPRRFFSAEIIADGRMRQALDLALFDWSARQWALPVWPDVQQLDYDLPAAATAIWLAQTGRDFHAGGLLMLMGDDPARHEVVEIAGLTFFTVELARPTQHAWPAGTRVYPARVAELWEEPAPSRSSAAVQRLSVRFLVTDQDDLYTGPILDALPQHRGRPVFELRPDESGGLDAGLHRLRATWDSGVALPLRTDVARRALPLQSWRRVMTMDASERLLVRWVLHQIRGQQVALWMPTWADDLTLVATTGSLALTLDVAHVGYTRYGSAQPGRRDVRIELHDGTVLYRRITGSTELDATTERLAIDAAIGFALDPADVRSISWMALSRLASDEVEFEHLTDVEGPMRLALAWRGVRDDEF